MELLFSVLNLSVLTKGRKKLGEKEEAQPVADQLVAEGHCSNQKVHISERV
jgi:hypothetical protein